MSGLRAIQFGVRIPVGARDFCIFLIGQTASGPSLASYSVGTGVNSWGKAARAWS